MIRILGVGTIAACLVLLAACRDPRDGSGAATPAPPVSTEPAAPPGMPLVPGQVETAGLTGGARGVHLLALGADTFVRVMVEQLGIDIVARLIDPEGRVLIQFDKLSSARPEKVVWVTGTAGTYRLEVKAWGRAASTGRYRVRFEVERPATEQDRARHQAELLFADGDRLRRESDPESRLRAEDKLRQAIDLWRRLDDRTRYADGLYLLALTYGTRDRQLAIETFENVVALLEDEADVHQKAAAVHEIAALHFDAGELRRAASLYRQAIPLRQQAQHLRGEANTFNDLGLTYKRLGEIDEALTNYRRALDRFRQLRDAENEALAWHNLGKGLLSNGMWPDARDSLQEALSLRRRLEDVSGQASTLIAIGQTWLQQGQPERALEAQREALALALSRQEKNRHQEAVALSGFAVAYQELGRLDQAFELHEQALESFRELDDRHNEANTLLNLGWVLDRQDQDRRAEEFYRQALALYEATEHRPGRILTLYSMALVERQLGEPALARRRLEAVLAEVERLRTLPRSRVLRYSYFATKQRYYEAYVDLLMELHRRSPAAGHDAAALGASERARARSQLDALTESGAALERGAAPELRARERALEAEIKALENERQEQFGDGGRGRVAVIEGRLRDLFLEHDRVQGDIRHDSPHYAALTQPRPLAAEEIQRRVVDRDTLLLEYDLGEERSYLWAVTPGGVSSFELPARKVIERAAERAYKLLSSSHLTASKVSAEIALEKLSRLLLQPVAGLLAEKRLLIVADGALQYIPFSALPEPLVEGGDGAPGSATGALPLVEKHEIVSMPSASTLAVLRRQIAGRPRPAKTVAVFADPVFELGDPRFRDESSQEPSPAVRGTSRTERRYDRLIYSRREAEDILALVPAKKALEATGFEAHRDAVMTGRLADYRFLHFATHGVLDAEQPGLSRLILSQRDRQGEKRDGVVYAHQIYDLELAADLVVLSACETALGAEIRGEGLLGLTQGFMYAGAASVLVSLWNVDDQATAELMARFYRQLLVEELRPAAALRAAQISIRRERRWQAPYFWAGFVLQGEWR